MADTRGGEATAASRAWRLLLLPAGRRLLEVSADAGERAALAASAGALVACGRRAGDEAAARARGGFDVVALGDPSAQGFDAAWVSAALGRTRGGEIPARDLGSLLAQVATHLRPGATLVLSLPNPLFGLPGMGRVLEHVVRLPAPSGPARGRWRLRPLTAASVAQAVSAAGFERVRCLAALPDARAPKFLVPVADPGASGYFFGRLAPRPRSISGRLAIACAEAVAGLGLLGPMTPSWEVVASRREAG